MVQFPRACDYFEAALLLLSSAILKNLTESSFKITRYLLDEGNRVTGINPNLLQALKTDIPMKNNLAELAEPVDIIQVFRNSAVLSALADEILELKWTPKMVWCQQGVVDVVFQKRLEQYGISVVMDACPYALRSFL